MDRGAPAALVCRRCALLCRLSGTALALIGSLASGPWASAQTPAPATLPTLTTIKYIRALSQDEGARGYRVRVSGIVTHFDEKADVGLIVHDGKFGQYLHRPLRTRQCQLWRDLRRGDLVEVEGTHRPRWLRPERAALPHPEAG